MLGHVLVESGAVDESELNAALEEQRESRERLGGILIRRGLDGEAVARGLATQLRLEYGPPPLRPEKAALDLVPRPLALRLRVVPLGVSGRTLRLAMEDPLAGGAVDDLQFRTGRRVEPVVASGRAIEEALVRAYGDEAVRALVRRLDGPLDGSSGAAVREEGPAGAYGETAELEGEAQGGDPSRGDGGDEEGLREASEAAPIVALVNVMLERALRAGASDVHIEPGAERLIVRARVDGVLTPILELPDHAGAAVVSRVKIMAGLDIAVKRKPQDGRSAVRVGDRRVGIRVSTLPSQDGEKVVLRLLDPRTARRPLDELGLTGDTGAGLRRVLRRHHGLFLVTGPTGSGKTTTLYGILDSLDRDARNVLTLEDPVEYRLPGLTQVQVQPRAGLTFASALRAVLRQDPDVVMVGEMRDRETAEVGLAAALTGHLVLSTLHTIDAPGAVARLGEMGAARYLIAGGLIGVLAQRLVRRLCPDCRTLTPVAGDELHELGLPTPPQLYAPTGCDACAGSGYRGRRAVYELLPVTAAIRELILHGATADAIREAAAAAGMRSLGADAWHAVESGDTSLDEARPLLTMLADHGRGCRACGARVATTAAFCPLCGNGLLRHCGCGAEIRHHWRFCGGCGERLESTSTASAPRPG